MATTTPNLGLVKPATTDSVDISAINGNMDKIDTAFGGSPQYIRQLVAKNDTYNLPLENGKAYLITLMTSSLVGQMLILATRYDDRIKATTIINEGAQFYTIEVSNNQWTVNAHYASWVNVLIY